MHVVLIEPAFPVNQREFVRALAAVGARVTAIGERPVDSFDPDLKGWLHRYHQVRSVVDERAVGYLVEQIMRSEPVDRLEATIEAHIMSTARVREALGIPGTSEHTAYLCRDKPAMKEALRQAGIPCAQSTGATSADAVWDFARRVGYPLILKPPAGAGASGTIKVDNDQQLAAALPGTGVERGQALAVEEFIEGHEGFYDTICINGRVVHDFACHYYPGVLEAMRTRWISPQFICTNRVDQDGYDEIREMGRRVVEALGIGTSATHMEWFYGPKGLKFSEIGCRPPGVRAWDLYAKANDIDIYREWAMAVVHGRPGARCSRRYSAGIIALRPSQDGVISGYAGLDVMQQRYGQWVMDHHLPPEGTPTQGVEAGYMANAWIRMFHPDYDELRTMLNAVGETVKVWAR